MSNLQFDSVRESDIGVYVCTAMVDGFDPVVAYGRLDINGTFIGWAKHLRRDVYYLLVKYSGEIKTKHADQSSVWFIMST